MKARRAGRVHQLELTAAAQARIKSGLSQTAFAELLGVSIKTLQNWEQGRTQPSGAAKTLIKVAIHSPKVLAKAMAAPMLIAFFLDDDSPAVAGFC